MHSGKTSGEFHMDIYSIKPMNTDALHFLWMDIINTVHTKLFCSDSSDKSLALLQVPVSHFFSHFILDESNEVSVMLMLPQG